MEIQEIVKKVLETEDLELDDRLNLISSLVNFGEIVPGISLKRKYGTDEVEVWFRSVDEQGNKEEEKAEWNDPSKIVQEYKRYLDKKRKNKHI